MKITVPEWQFSANPNGNSQIDLKHEDFSLFIENLVDAKNRLSVTHCAVIPYERVQVHFAREERLMRKL